MSKQPAGLAPAGAPAHHQHDTALALWYASGGEAGDRKTIRKPAHPQDIDPDPVLVWHKLADPAKRMEKAQRKQQRTRGKRGGRG